MSPRLRTSSGHGQERSRERPITDREESAEAATGSDRAGFPPYEVEQRLIAERFWQEPSHSRLSDTLARPRVTVGRNENGRDGASVSDQALLQIESAHSPAVQLDVQDQAGRAASCGRREEFASRGKRLDGIPRQPNQAAQCPADRKIIIHYGNHRSSVSHQCHLLTGILSGRRAHGLLGLGPMHDRPAIRVMKHPRSPRRKERLHPSDDGGVPPAATMRASGRPVGSARAGRSPR